LGIGKVAAIAAGRPIAFVLGRPARGQQTRKRYTDEKFHGLSFQQSSAGTFKSRTNIPRVKTTIRRANCRFNAQRWGIGNGETAFLISPR
jgi:hypothetical protein